MRGGKRSASKQKLAHARGRAHEAVGEADRCTCILWPFRRDAPVLAAVAPVSVSAREWSMLMGRGLWRGVQSAASAGSSTREIESKAPAKARRDACQAPRPCVVTKLAWSKRRPGAVKPCLRTRPCSVYSRGVDGSCPGRPDLTSLS